MKKKIAAVAIAISIVTALAVGCGSRELSNEYIKISQYKELEIAKVEETEVKDEAVDQQIQAKLQQNAKVTEVTDRAVETGDTAVIDYVGTKEGVEFEGGSATDYRLEIGSGSFIPGFEDAIIGHNTGDVFDIPLTFPEDYNSADLAGQAVSFNVTVKKIEKSDIPELTDEFVQTVSQKSKTVDEYKKEVKEEIDKQYKDQAKKTLGEEVWQALLDKVEVKKYPKDKLKKAEEQMRKNYEQYAAYYNVEFDEFIKTYMNMDQETFKKEMDTASKKAVKQEEAIDLIAKKEKLQPTKKETEKKYEEYVKTYGYQDVKALKEAATEEVLNKLILQEIVQDWLIENSKQVDPSKLEKKEEKKDSSKDTKEETKKTEDSNKKKDDAPKEDDASKK